MPAIKLKKVTAEYLAEKEKVEKSKEKSKKNLEDVVEEENAEKEEANKEDEESKTHNFLEVEILYDKRKRALPVAEQKMLDWLDSNLMKKDDVTLPLLTLYEYYSEVCQMQGENVVDVPVFNRYVREKFGKTLGFQENSPYRVLIKERKKQEKKPKVQGETLQIKIRDIIINVINELGNPRKGLRFHAISRAIIQKYPAQRVDLYPNKLKKALERGVMAGYLENVKGVGMCGYYRVPGEPTKEDPDDKKDKTKKEKSDEEKEGEEEGKQNGDVGDSEEKSTDDEKKPEDKPEGEEGSEDKEDEDAKPAPEKKQRKRKPAKKKKKPEEKWARRASKHSDPEKVEDVFPLAITYQTDPKEASGGKIRSYIGKYYYKDVSNDRLRKALDKGVEDGFWELVSGAAPSGRYHLLIETFNPGRSENLKDQIAQALVACNEPKQASASLIKKYITEYHSKLNVEARPYLFKHALERACSKGILRQLSGIGATGTFQLSDPFYPSPAILAGDSSDEEDEDDDDNSDVDEKMEYVPRPTKRGRMAPRPKPRQTPVPSPKKSKPKPKAATVSKKSSGKKGQARNVKASSVKYTEESSENESEAEQEEYTPTPSKRRGGVATPARKATPVQEVKSTSKSRGKAVTKSDKKEKARPKRAAAISPAFVDRSDDESDEDDAPMEYTPTPSKSRGGGRQETTSKSSSKSRGSAKRKLIEESDADDDDSDVEAPPPKKQRGKPTNKGRSKEDEKEITPPKSQKAGSAKAGKATKSKTPKRRR